jgi:hypothetical protein
MAMRVLAGSATLAPVRPRRPGKYDRYLTGETLELTRRDVPMGRLRTKWPRRFVSGLQRRAVVRGLKVGWQVLADGTLVVTSAERVTRPRPHVEQLDVFAVR